MKKFMMLMALLGGSLIFTATPVMAANPVKQATNPGEIVALLILIAGFGFGIGCLGLIANHIFNRRTGVTYLLMKKKPGWSLVMGIVVTLFSLLIIAAAQQAPAIQLFMLLVYGLALGLFALGGVTRLASQIVSPQPFDDDVPSTCAHLKGGIILMGMNLVLIVGSIFCLGILLTGIGASFFSYFAGMGNMAAGASDKVKVVDLPPGD